MRETERGWSEPAETVLDILETGLTREGGTAAARVARAHILPEAPRPSPLVRLGRQLNNLLILVLIGGAASGRTRR